MSIIVAVDSFVVCVGEAPDVGVGVTVRAGLDGLVEIGDGVTIESRSDNVDCIAHEPGDSIISFILDSTRLNMFTWMHE